MFYSVDSHGMDLQSPGPGFGQHASSVYLGRCGGFILLTLVLSDLRPSSNISPKMVQELGVIFTLTYRWGQWGHWGHCGMLAELSTQP